VGNASWRFMVLSVWSGRAVPLQRLQSGTALPSIMVGPGTIELYFRPYQGDLYLHSY